MIATLRRPVIVAIMVVLATSGCARTVDGSLTGSVPPSTAPAGPSRFPSSTSRPSGPSIPARSPSASASAARGLTALLEPVPAGYLPGHLAWDRNVRPTAAQFVAEFFFPRDRTAELRVLRSEDLQRVTHRVWYSGTRYEDIVLLQFATARGAAEHFHGEIGVTVPDRSLSSSEPGGRGRPVVFVSRKADSKGNIRSRSYAQVGRVVVESHAYTTPPFDAALFLGWLRTQIARLP